MRRRNRLTSKRDLDRVFREGRRSSTRALLCAVGPGSGEARVAVTAAGELRGAVQRNRAKRLLREAVNGLFGSLRAGADIVLVARLGISGKSFQEVEVEVRKVLRGAGAM